MLRVYGCIVDHHDIRLVLLAGVVCLLACFTAFSLAARAKDKAFRSLLWLVAAGSVAGSGVWATHFIAMLAFLSGFPATYDIARTLLSVVLAIVFACGGFVIARHHQRPVIGGAVLGLGVGAMHYAGMSALVLPASQHWDAGYVVSSLSIGIAAGAVAFSVASWRSSPLFHLYAAALLILGICGLHFAGMTALRLAFDPTISVPDQVIPPGWLAVIVTVIICIILAFSFLGTLVDANLANRVAELEATKANLEATTRQLGQALEVAVAGSEAKSQFVATMSHELRTPLNAIIGFSEILGLEMFGPLGDKRYVTYVNDIAASGRHLLSLINDVLDLSRIDAQQFEIREGAFDLTALIGETVGLLGAQAQKAEITLAIEAAGGQMQIRGDARRFRQILLNLLSNALKFTPAGGRVSVGLSRHAGGVDVSVTDTGIGMAEKDIPKALERFGQIDHGLNRNFEGSGLGLPLSKRMIELHGGSLKIESTKGAGTVATVSIPRNRVIGSVDTGMIFATSAY